MSTDQRIQSRWAKPALIGKYLVLIGLVLFFLMPVYAVVVTALKDPSQVSVPRMWELPQGLHWASFSKVWPKIQPGLVNSMMMAVPAALISSMLGAANGFVLAKWRFPGADVVFPLILFGMFIPYQAILLPLAQTLRVTGIRDVNDGLVALVLVHVIYGLPITTLIFRGYFAGISDEIIEAAQMDGAGMLRTFFHVILPVAPPAFAVSMIWQFTSAWNDFLFGLVVTRTATRPVTIALSNIAGGQTVPFNEAMASALLACLPTLLVYVLLGRFFMRGLMAGALKG